MALQFIQLSEAEWQALTTRIFAPIELATEAEMDAYRNPLFAMMDRLEARLSEHWDQVDDWEVGTDWNPYQHPYVCGGIYSERIFCRAYVELIHATLQTAEHPGDWAHSTVCEILSDDGNGGIDQEDRGEFIIMGNTVYVDSTMSPEHLAQLQGLPA